MDSRKPERHRVVSLMNRSLSGFIYEICSSYPRKRHFSIKNGIEWHPTIFVDAISCQQKGSSLPFPLVSKRFDSFHHFLDHFSLMFGRSRWRPKRRSSLWSANGNLPPRNRAWVDFIFVLLCFSLSLNQWKSYVGKQKSHRQKGRIVVAIVDQSCCFFFFWGGGNKRKGKSTCFFLLQIQLFVFHWARVNQSKRLFENRPPRADQFPNSIMGRVLLIFFSFYRVPT